MIFFLQLAQAWHVLNFFPNCVQYIKWCYDIHVLSYDGMEKVFYEKIHVICCIRNECETQLELPPFHCFISPPFLPIFHSIGPFVSISFAQRLFCFRVIWWSYFPLIIFSHFKPILSLDIYYDYNCTLSLPYYIYSLVLTQTTWPACILTFTSGSKTIVNWTDIYIDIFI